MCFILTVPKSFLLTIENHTNYFYLKYSRLENSTVSPCLQVKQVMGRKGLGTTDFMLECANLFSTVNQNMEKEVRLFRVGHIYVFS